VDQASNALLADLLPRLVQWELGLFLFALSAILAAQLLTGQINTTRLLHGRIRQRKPGEDLYVSPERIQLLIFTLGAAFYYLVTVVENPHPGTFPPVPDAWLALLGGSNAIYLTGKAFTQLGSRVPIRHRSE